MAYIDLSIPYVEKGGDGKPDARNKSRESRLRTAARAMELGYTGVAYDSPFHGVLSDSNICHISPFSYKDFMEPKAGGSFAALVATVSFHRDLLGIPRDSTFRQYSRITISVDNTVASSVLNNRNRLLRIYDIVAVRPLSQMAFDQACQTSEVDIIALDLSQKLPFRLKLPMVQSAIKRGLYFEICYSHLITEGHVRRQILSDAKLLGDWTHGKNLIISSAATSYSGVRGPHDVANLATVFLGITMERAKATVSGNCRLLLANALRKKDCYFKEVIKVERVLQEEHMDNKEDWFKEWTEWDPISSGEGDLPSLDDMAKLFSAASRCSKGQNAIDFTSCIDGMAPKSPLFSKSNTHKHDSVGGIHSFLGVEQHSNSCCVTADNITFTVAKSVPMTVNEEKPTSAGNVMMVNYAFENPWCPSPNDFCSTSEIKPTNVSMKGVELVGQFDNVSATTKSPMHSPESLQCPFVCSTDPISPVHNVKIMNVPMDHVTLEQFLGKNVEKTQKDEALCASVVTLHGEPPRTSDAPVVEGTSSTDMQTNCHPGMLIEIQEQSRSPCETSTSADPGKIEEQDQLVAYSEASFSKDVRVKMELRKRRASSFVVKSTKVALANGLKVTNHRNIIDKINTSSQFLKRTESKRRHVSTELIIPQSDNTCFFPESDSLAKVEAKMVKENVELPVTATGVAQGHLRKSGKHRRKGRARYLPYSLVFKNICKPMFFERTTGRLRRLGKLV